VSALDVFRGGTPSDARQALAVGRAALDTGRDLAWHVDPANVDLLARLLRDRALGPRVATSCDDRLPAVTAVLAAVDEAHDRTVVANEGALVPKLRGLAAHGVTLALSTGRPYVLPPPALDISTNDLCGLECVMCKNRAPRRDPRSMAPDDIRALLDQAAAWGVAKVALTGAGEPFRDPEMLGYVRYANERGLRVGLTSNGFPISEAIATELAQRAVSVSLSIHGATAATHDAIVGVPKASDNALRAIQRLVAARDAHPRSALRVNVSTVIQRANLREIPALARWALELGCNEFNVQPVNLQGGSIHAGAITRRDDVQLLATLWPTAGDAAALGETIAALVALGREHPRFLNTTEERLELFERYFDDSSRAALAVTCRVGERFLGVDHRGAIKPCYRLPWSHGDARLVDVRALWNSKAYAETRAMIEGCPLTCMNNCFFRKTGSAAQPTA
jgi:MoaA/NifB/PqqE/SkfB family radical SAM enzyme